MAKIARIAPIILKMRYVGHTHLCHQILLFFNFFRGGVAILQCNLQWPNQWKIEMLRITLKLHPNTLFGF